MELTALPSARRLLRGLFAFLCIAVGLYPALYFLIDREFGLLSSKTPELLADLAWNIGFYAHIVPGGLALLIGWAQFSPGLRARRPALHRRIGRVYVLSVLVSGLAGLYIGFSATGGLPAALGFISLALIWLYTTLMAWRSIVRGQVEAHARLMRYSYAASFAAVTLRIWLPLLIALTGSFDAAYPIVAWLCWVPNLAAVWAASRWQQA
ncbi:MAG: DUF2306 domain-containing protein [Bacteroidia bacterium]|nr:DUF2306 domain-containing protein [Bacteroidia bacterium]